MNNQAAQAMPELPVAIASIHADGYWTTDDRRPDWKWPARQRVFSEDQMRQYARDYAAMLAAAPAASGGEDKGDPVCREDDGCPTEGAVLKRFWRAVNTDDTKQLMAFYGVADVPALIEQQVQHVQSLQIKLKAHEPKRDQFPKSPREG